MTARSEIFDVASTKGWKRSGPTDLAKGYTRFDWQKGQRWISVSFTPKNRVSAASTERDFITGTNKAARVIEELKK